MQESRQGNQHILHKYSIIVSFKIRQRKNRQKYIVFSSDFTLILLKVRRKNKYFFCKTSSKVKKIAAKFIPPPFPKKRNANDTLCWVIIVKTHVKNHFFFFVFQLKIVRTVLNCGISRCRVKYV